jgi:hypothetical protein
MPITVVASGSLPAQGQGQTNQGRGAYNLFWPEVKERIHNWPRGALRYAVKIVFLAQMEKPHTQDY